MESPNVLLVILDSVRAQNVGAYGYHRNTTPFLESYADRATVYEQARAPGIHSVASHASIWTGTHVAEHQVINHEDQLKPDTTVWESLADGGYRTGIFTTNTVVGHASNLAAKFDHEVTGSLIDKQEKLFEDAHGPADVEKHEGVVGNIRRSLEDDRPIRALLNNVHHFYLQRKGKVVDESLETSDLIEEFLSWSGESDEPWGACLNLMDAHFPYEPSPEYDHWGGEKLRELHADLDKPPANEFIQGRPWWQLEAFEHLYDGAILELDQHIETLIEGLKERNEHGNTLVVITSDHGEGFGELSRLTGRTRLVDHSWGIHEALLHVPLIVKYPEQSDQVRVSDFATLTKFNDTVEEVLEEAETSISFVPEEDVIASTQRLRESEDMIFEGSDENVNDYYGPWRTVYRNEVNKRAKYMDRGKGSKGLKVELSNVTTSLNEDVSEEIQSIFGSLNPVSVKKELSNDLTSDVEDRLTDLGYIR